MTLFIEMLDLFFHNPSKGEFPELISAKDDIATAHTQRYFDHVNNLRKDLENLFDNALTMEICEWMINPFTAIAKKLM